MREMKNAQRLPCLFFMMMMNCGILKHHNPSFSTTRRLNFQFPAPKQFIIVFVADWDRLIATNATDTELVRVITKDSHLDQHFVYVVIIPDVQHASVANTDAFVVPNVKDTARLSVINNW